jgi:hypothetical protein
MSQKLLQPPPNFNDDIPLMTLKDVARKADFELKQPSTTGSSLLKIFPKGMLDCCRD